MRPLPATPCAVGTTGSSRCAARTRGHRRRNCRRDHPATQRHRCEDVRVAHSKSGCKWASHHVCAGDHQQPAVPRPGSTPALVGREVGLPVPAVRARDVAVHPPLPRAAAHPELTVVRADQRCLRRGGVRRQGGQPAPAARVEGAEEPRHAPAAVDDPVDHRRAELTDRLRRRRFHAPGALTGRPAHDRSDRHRLSQRAAGRAARRAAEDPEPAVGGGGVALHPRLGNVRAGLPTTHHN